MNPLKLRRMKRLAEALKSVDKAAAWDLISMIEAYEQPPQPDAEMLRESLPSALKEVASFLKPYKWCLAGGLALVQWVNIRVTYDVDVVVMTDDLQKIRDSFPSAKPNNFGVSVNVSKVNVDLMDSGMWPWAEEAVLKAVEKDIDGAKIRVMTPEFLVLFKIDSMRDKDNQDVFALLRIHGVAQKVRPLMQKYLPDRIDDLESAIAIADLMI